MNQPLTAITKDFKEISYYNIDGIKFMDNTFISFKESNKYYCKKYNINSQGICERSYPNYFNFFSEKGIIRIVFTAKGLFSKKRNSDNFRKIYNIVYKAGYTSYDLS